MSAAPLGGGRSRPHQSGPTTETPNQPPPILGPFAAEAHALLRSGLGSPVPLPFGRKKSPPDNFTGYDGYYASGADVQAWLDEGRGRGNIALRPADDVLGIDVDTYDGKAGAATLAAFEEQHGTLPLTVVSTSREEGGESGIRWFRVPPGNRWPSVMGPGVELIHRGHRYGLWKGSKHPDHDTRYRLDDQRTGEVNADTPAKGSLPALSDEQVEGLVSLRRSTEKALAAEYTGPTYEQWTDEQRTLVDEHVEAMVERSLADLRASWDWSLHQRDNVGEPEGRTWEKLTADKAQQFRTLLAEGWSGLDADNLKRRFLAAVPTHSRWSDPLGEAEDVPPRKRWTLADAELKWANQTKPVRGAGRIEPPPGINLALAVQAEPVSLDECHATFTKWLGEGYDLDVLDAVLATAAVEKIGGDPAWLLVVSGSGAAKTETVIPLAAAGAHVTSTISSEGALLSGTSRRERTKQATGGLLRKIGSSGVLVIKDVTSILSMNRDSRAAVLAAMREVYDGRWERNLGTDGGQSLEWEGRIVVIGAVTTAWDKAHSVIAAMGDRFVLVRIDSSKGRQASGRQALSNTGHEVEMRAELGAAVAGVLAGMDPKADLTVTEEEEGLLYDLANVVTLARTAVESDFRGDVIDAHAPEMPTRLVKQLKQILRGGLALGLSRQEMLRVVARCAADTMPPLRLEVLLDLAAHPESLTNDVRKRLDKPRMTVDRTLQALHALGCLTLREVEVENTWNLNTRTEWRYSLSEEVEVEVVKTLGRSQKCHNPRTPDL